MTGKTKRTVSVQTMLSWVYEAQNAHSEWRAQSWNDYEFRDGHQWTQAAYDRLVAKGINPLTINRIFPILNLIHGQFLRDQQDIVAKGRTKEDNELAQVMSEAFAYVKDQNLGAELISRAFNEEIVTGYGCMQVDKNSDPRQESVRWRQLPWYSSWWDPFASPWLNKDDCRYFFTAGWKNLDDVLQVFPEKSKDILDKYAHLSTSYYVPDLYDQGNIVEEYHRYLSSNHWVNSDRKRIRPIEMWYTSLEKGWFAIMPDSRVIDLDKLSSPNEQVEVVRYSTELLTATVKKMRVATFISDYLLQDVPTPYAHDKYPFVPFIGYLDRFDCPFGIPRQIKEQSMEVNKRRSMALSLISNRRVIIEEDSAKDVNRVYEEANRQDGFIVLKKGKMGTFKIEELSALASPQIDLMHQSEREIQEIVGANDEALGKESKLQSGVALEKKENYASTVSASLFENAKNAMKRLGELTLAMVQSEWTGPKVLRVTDRMSGVEKFIEVNQKIYDENAGAIVIKNNITEAKFDIVVANAPITDTMREKNMELLFSAINKAPPEAVGPLLNMAFEISDIPNKEALLRQVRAATGMELDEESQSEAEREMAAEMRKQQKQQQEAEEMEMQRREREIQMALHVARLEKLKAETGAAQRKTERDDWEAGAKLGREILEAQTGGVQ